MTGSPVPVPALKPGGWDYWEPGEQLIDMLGIPVEDDLEPLNFFGDDDDD